MHKFLVNFRGRQMVSTEIDKQNFLDRLLDDYENRNITVSVSIEIPTKRINQDQSKLYKAFILKASNHFGTDFPDIHKALKVLHPLDEEGEYIPISKWNTYQLNNFINQASSYMAEFGFHF